MSARPSPSSEENRSGGMGRHIALIGYRAVGKSTIGALVARRARRAFVDADLEIERRAGRSIAEIFANDGETAFRDWEAQVIAETLAGEAPVVLATESKALAARGQPAEPAELRRRLAASLERGRSAHRPALTSAGLLDEIEPILARRIPLYRETAHAEVAGLNRSVSEVAADVFRLARSCFETISPPPGEIASALSPGGPPWTGTASEPVGEEMESESRRSS